MFAQKLEVGKYCISNFLGLDSTRTEFKIEPMAQLESLIRAGYMIDLQEDNQFSIFGYAFCGVGEKAYVEGTYKLKGDNKIELNYERIVYKDLGTETRRTAYKKTVTYQYDLSKNDFHQVK